MKKHLGILVILLIAGITGSGFFFWQSEASGNRIQLEEVKIIGDKEKVSDVELTGSIRYLSRIKEEYHWDFALNPKDNEINVSDKKQIKHDLKEVYDLTTDFAYASTYILKDLRALCEYNDEAGIIPYEDPDSVNPELRKAAEAMMDFRKSSNYAEVYKMNDLIDYYPLFNELNSIYGDSFIAREDDETMSAFFSENFRIPVSDDMKIILMRDDTIESRFNVFYSKEGSDAYEPQTVYCSDKDNYYYSFSTHTRDGSVVDTGELTLGYGIYRAELIENEKGEIVPDFRNSELFIALDPEIEILKAGISDNGNLYYMYEEDKEGIKTVRYALADINTGNVRADFSFVNAELYDIIENQYGLLMKGTYNWNTAYIFVPKISEDNFGEPVILDGSIEKYEIDITNADVYADGERIFIAGTDNNGDVGLAAYEKGKPVFYGAYRNSMEKPYDSSQAPVTAAISVIDVKVKSK